MHLLLLILAGAAVLYGPRLWAGHTLRRHARPRPDFPGTGGQLARHLLDRFGMEEVKLEVAPPGGDHYDPATRTVRLAPDHFEGRSLTAVAVAAHEVGHALQHHQGYRPLLWRTRLVGLTRVAERIGSAILMGAPVVAAITRSPGASAVVFLAGIASMGISTLVHLVTLPVELDASFRRALPILLEGEYIEKRDERAARAVLRACALTYVAASLASLLNLWQWIRIWRR